MLREFEAYAEWARVQWGVPGMAIAVVHGGKVAYAKGFGVKQKDGSASVVPAHAHGGGG